MKLKYILYSAAGVLAAAFILYRIFFVHEKVTAVNVVRGELVSLIYATGKVTADDIAVLRSEAGGTVTFVGPKEGTMVRKGETLLRSNTSEISLKIDQAENDIEAARVDLLDRKANLDRLYELLQGHSITQKEYDTAKRDYELSQIVLERRKIMLNQEKENLSKRMITAPFDGIIYNVSVNLGDYLPQNTECFRILVPSSIMIEGQVDEQDLAKVKNGQHALVAFDAYPGQKYDAVVFRIAPQTDEATKTSKVYLKIGSQSPVLNMGMTATVNIISGKKKDALIIPRSSVVTSGTRQTVFQIVEGKLHQAEITLGSSEGNFVEVLSGIGEGSQVVRDPKPAYVENMKVAL